MQLARLLNSGSSSKKSLKKIFKKTYEIISVDSRQVYRGMDIGTGKDLHEYGTGRSKVPYHLIDIVDPSTDFSLFDYQQHAFRCITELNDRDVVPILCGGTGLYLDAVLRGYKMVKAPENPELRLELQPLSLEELKGRLIKLKPDYHTTSDFKKRERLVRAIEIAEYSRANPVFNGPYPRIKPLIIGISWPRRELRERIKTRLHQRLEQGMIEEVENLHNKGLSWEKLHSFGLEYRFVAAFLQGKTSRNEMFQKLNTAICRFAKRQETWFRGMERKGLKIHWVERGVPDVSYSIIASHFRINS